MAHLPLTANQLLLPRFSAPSQSALAPWDGPSVIATLGRSVVVLAPFGTRFGAGAAAAVGASRPAQKAPRLLPGPQKSSAPSQRVFDVPARRFPRDRARGFTSTTRRAPRSHHPGPPHPRRAASHAHDAWRAHLHWHVC